MRDDPELIRPDHEDADVEDTPFDLVIELEPNEFLSTEEEDVESSCKGRGAGFSGWRAAAIWMTTAALVLGRFAIV